MKNQHQPTAAPNSNAPNFTKSQPVNPKVIAKETAQEVVHEVMPKAEAKKIEAEAKTNARVEKAPAKDDTKKDTAAHGDDDLMSKKAQP